MNKKIITLITTTVIAACLLTLIVTTGREKETHRLNIKTEEKATVHNYEPNGIRETISSCLDTTTDKIYSEPTYSTTESVVDDIQEQKTYTDFDLECLASVICVEGGGCSDEMKMMIGNVVMNRVEDSRFPSTIYEVITQHNQYTFNDGVIWTPSWATDDVMESCYNIAERLLNGERVCPKNVIYQAEFTQGSGVYMQIDNMYFCYG